MIQRLFVLTMVPVALTLAFAGPAAENDQDLTPSPQAISTSASVGELKAKWQCRAFPKLPACKVR